MTITYIDRLDSLKLKVDGLYERFETRFVQRTIRPGQRFVDVGAHIGYYSTIAAEIVGPGGAVHAFEPCPDNLELLRKNVEPFGSIVRVYPAAVAEDNGRAGLYLSDINSGDHHLYQSDGCRLVEVDVVSLDSIVEVRRGIDFIKIDVQGSECRALRGAAETIWASPDLKGIVEFSPKHLVLAGSSVDEFWETLLDLGFRVYQRYGDRFDLAKYLDLKALRRHINLFISQGPIE